MATRSTAKIDSRILILLAGATYKVMRALTVYGSYSINNRASLPRVNSSARIPPPRVLLPTNLASDPPLKQVVAKQPRSARAAAPVTDASLGKFGYDMSIIAPIPRMYIYGISTSIASGFFQNVGIDAPRKAAILDPTYQIDRVSAYLQYSYLKATFRSAFSGAVAGQSVPRRERQHSSECRQRIAVDTENSSETRCGHYRVAALVSRRHMELRRTVLLSRR